MTLQRGRAAFHARLYAPICADRFSRFVTAHRRPEGRLQHRKRGGQGTCLIIRSLPSLVPLKTLSYLWGHLLKTGEPVGLKPIGKATRETARIEAGLPRLGPDINERIVPPEANLEGIAFSLTKGCYPGQEVVARMDTYGAVKRRLVGLVIEGTEKDQPETGAKLFSGTREVGWVSSATFSPLLQKPIALGFSLRDFTPTGTQLEVETHGQKFPVSISALPFTASQ